MRLQKYLSTYGICSRRKGEELIIAGRVFIGKKKAFIGDKIDLNTDKVYIDRKLVTAERKKVYILLNKPRGYITTTNDPKNRKTIFDLIKEIPERVYPVGRLDYDTEGLLLLTNDGDLTFKLTHPKHQINKTYKVKCKGIINLAVIDILRSGVILDDGYKTQKAKVYVIELNKKNSLLEITIYEGKNRQIRKMFESLGHPVIRLTRTKIGDIQIGDLKSSSYRFLKKAEVNKLKNFYKKSIR